MLKKITFLSVNIIFFLFIYNSVKAQEISPSSPSAQTEDSVREKVKEKVESVRKNPKAYIGTITDKTGDTIQIKNGTGEIQLISVVKENVTFVNFTKTAKIIKFDDIAIGDFIVAMGYTNGNEVLEAKRVLLTKVLEVPNRQVFYGNVLNIDKKILTLQKNDLTELLFEFPKKWSGPEIKQIQNGSKIIIVSALTENKNIIRTIELISSTSTSPTPTKTVKP